MTAAHALQRQRYSKPCPTGCGRLCDRQAATCRPCQLARRRHGLLGLVVELERQPGAREVALDALFARRCQDWQPAPQPLPSVSISNARQLPLGNWRAYCSVCGTVRIAREPITDECCPVRPAPMPAPAAKVSSIAPVVAPPPPSPTFDVFCLLCARGLGRDGVRTLSHRLPTRSRCTWCGGLLLAEELSGGTRLLHQRDTVGRRVFDGAAFERAAR